MTDRPDDLDKWLRFLEIEDCTCPYEFQPLGRLYGISMGDGWVRMATDVFCKHHALPGVGDDKI